MHLVNIYLSQAYNVPGISLCAGDLSVNKKKQQFHNSTSGVFFIVLVNV